MARVALLGAHTALAKALVECIGERGIEIDLRLATVSDHCEEGLDLIDEKLIASADLVVVAFRGEHALAAAERARKLGKPVLDMTGGLPGKATGGWLWPGIDRDAGRVLVPGRVYLIPVGLAQPIVCVLRALDSFGVGRAAIATYESTAVADQPGMNELSEQVRSVFLMREQEARVFDGRIAFSCLPIPGDAGSALASDELLASAIRDGLEHDEDDADDTDRGGPIGIWVTRVVVPTFSADAAVIHLEVPGTPDRTGVIEALENGRAIRVVEDRSSSSIEVIGREDVLVGRVRVAPQNISLWMASDRLRRGSATLAALVIERWLRG